MSTEHAWRKRSPNLVRREKPKGSGRYYYSYIHPITRQEVGMGTDFEKANAAARVLGNKLMRDSVRQLVTRVDRPRALFHATLDARFTFW